MKQLSVLLFTLLFSAGMSMAQDPYQDLLPDQGYELGGLLFAGTFPINNPVSTGDYAYAYLYRVEEGQCVPVDTVLFDTLGYFWFSQVLPGYYVLKAGLLEHSTRFQTYLPAYHWSAFNWTASDTILVDHDIYNAAVYMVPAGELLPGSGHIRGNLLCEYSTGSTVPLGGGQVVLADLAGNPFRIDYADSLGAFRFDQIPAGEFMVYGEYTGSNSQQVAVSLDSVHPTADSVAVMVYSEMPGVNDKRASVPQVSLFPNPVTVFVQMEINLVQAEEISVSVYHPMGQQLLGRRLHCRAGKTHERLDLSSLTPGIYLMLLQGTDDQWRLVKKFVKK